MKLRPNGFPRYQDKSSSLSALVNKFLRNNCYSACKIDPLSRGIGVQK
jgi:hypothetical protein